MILPSWAIIGCCFRRFAVAAWAALVGLVLWLNSSATLGQDAAWQTMATPAPVYSIDQSSESQGRLLLAGGHQLLVLEPVTRGASPELPTSWVQFPQAKLAQLVTQGDLAFVAGATSVEYGFVACIGVSDASLKWKIENLDSRAICLAWADGVVLVGCEDGSIVALDAKHAKVLWTAKLHSKLVTSVVNIGNGLAASGDWTGKIVTFHVDDGGVGNTFTHHRDTVTELIGLPPDDSFPRPRLVSASRDGTVRLWYPTQNRLVRFVQLDQPVTSIAAIDTTHFLAATGRHAIQRINLGTAKATGSLAQPLDYVHAIHVWGESLILSNGRNQVARLALELDAP